VPPEDSLWGMSTSSNEMPLASRLGPGLGFNVKEFGRITLMQTKLARGSRNLDRDIPVDFHLH
jgi:hypothetical protein